MFKPKQLAVAAMLLASSAAAQADLVTSLTITGGDFVLYGTGTCATSPYSACITAGSTINTVDGLFEGPSLTTSDFLGLPMVTFTSASQTSSTPSVTGNPIQGVTAGPVIALDLGSFYMTWFGATYLQAPDTNGIAFGTWTPTSATTGNFDISWNTFLVGGVFNAPSFWHLTGTATTTPVPVPAAAWLLGSGLLGLIGVARRKRQ